VTYDGTTIDSNLGWTVALSHGGGEATTRLLRLDRGGSGRADRALYMPALVATRHNRQLGQTYRALCSAGKPRESRDHRRDAQAPDPRKRPDQG